ncbi:colicin E3-like toxin immunity protein [Yersinia enterocolitica]|uniref:colicin E3-like toxin immunity protein n=1 Tax=Yersinia enterocolitica TaxID=630 RepID=UPI0032FF293E|nr:cloacin [Yersinia enterocolitica]
MGLKLRLTWFDKTTNVFVGTEYSKDFGDDDTIIERLELPLDDTMNNGEFDVAPSWITSIQPYFKNIIAIDNYDYFIAFDYRDEW